jgi:hypothetical protein
LVLAIWGAASVFVLWLALVSIVRRHWQRRQEAQWAQAVQNVPEPTPEEILEAQALGLLPRRPDPGQRSS